MAHIPPGPMPSFRLKSVGTILAAPTCKELFWLFKAVSKLATAASLRGEIALSIWKGPSMLLWASIVVAIDRPRFLASSVMKDSKSRGRSSIVWGAKVNVKRAHSPKIWQLAWARFLWTRTRGVALESKFEISTISEAFSIIFWFWACEARSRSCPDSPWGTETMHFSLFSSSFWTR